MTWGYELRDKHTDEMANREVLPLPCAIITIGLDRASFDRELALIYHKRRSQLARSRPDCSMELIPQLSAHHRVSCQKLP
jgi:hypothetical protein